MRYQFFTVPIHSFAEAQRELNNFCANHRIAAVEKQFVANGDKSLWAFCITYVESVPTQPLPRKSKIDYREVLDEKDFTIYAKLRALRKELSEKEGVPAYALFTNEQLATMVQKKVNTARAMNAIDGIGKAKMDKYGNAFLSVLKEEFAKQNLKAEDEANKN